MMNSKKISATAMSEVEVTHVSLVKRGANRQPIKIHKSENGNETMKKGTQATLDLASIGAKAIKSEEQNAPVLVAAIVKKGEGERISELLKDVDGIEVVSVTSDEANDCDVLNFVEGATADENSIVYKHDDNLALIVTGVKSSTQKMEFWANSTSFKENIQKTSFFPNLREASYTLVDTLANIVYEGDDAEVAQKAEQEVGAFGEYVNNLVKALPVKVIKSLEGIDFNKPEAAQEEVAAKAEGDETASTDDKATDTKETTADQEVAAKSEDGEAAAKSEDAPKEEQAPAAAAKSEDEAPAWAVALTQKMDKMGERLEQVETQVSDTAKKADEAASQVAESKSLVEKAESVVASARGTVVADAQDESFDDEIIPDQHNNDDLYESGIELY